MASYSTIPADVDSSSENSLNKPAKTSLKRIFLAAAVTSFALGALAATALEPVAAPAAVMEFDTDDWCADYSVSTYGYCDCVNPEDDGNTWQLCDNDAWDSRDVSFMDSIACTPYGYAPHNTNDPNVKADWDPFTRIMLLGYPNKQGAWGCDGCDEFFVFHGSDGSGLQSDCLGDNYWYTERFGYNANGWDKIKDVTKDYPLNDEGKVSNWADNGWHFEDAMPGDGYCWDEDVSPNWANPWDYQRHYCAFVHPGTKTVYQDYYAGWAPTGYDPNSAAHMIEFTSYDGNGEFPDNCGMLHSSYSGCWHPDYRTSMLDVIEGPMASLYEAYGEYAVAFPLFPWVCGEASTTNGMNKITWPTIATGDQKCYADNEVADTKFPPYVKFYYGYFTEDYELHLEMAEFGPDGFVGYHYGDGTGFNGQVFTPVTDDYDDGRNRVW